MVNSSWCKGQIRSRVLRSIAASILYKG
ncbi:hypothetical protein VCHC41B1_1695B, partial [Vibrio cholerae HC-41B1]